MALALRSERKRDRYCIRSRLRLGRLLEMTIDDADLRREVNLYVSSLPNPRRNQSVSLNGGAAGLALFLYEASDFVGEQSLLDISLQHLASGVELLNEQEISTSLYRGLPGFGWVLQHIASTVQIEWAEEALDDIDNALTEAVKSAPAHINIDLVDGLAGLLIYALSRPHRASAKALLDSLIWRCSDMFSANSGTETAISAWGTTDLGVAHGTPGLLAALSIAHRSRLLPPPVLAALQTGFDALWNARLAVIHQNAAYFPHRLGEASPARLAWCYGNFGLAFAFMRAAELDSQQVNRMRSIIKSSIEQFDTPSARLLDSSLCHGLAGAALAYSIFSRNAELDAHLSEACEALAHRAKRMIMKFSNRKSDGTLIFPYILKGNQIETDTFLEGSTGVYLSLISISRGLRPKWADLLLF